MAKEIVPGYFALLADIKRRVRTAQYRALQAVNKELVALYWDIGRLLVERQGSAGHGDAIAERLALDLRAEFPGMSGFSRRNIFYMRQFYLAYSVNAKVQPLVAQIAWTHNLILLQRCKDPLEREFYLRMAAKHGWSKTSLSQHIDSGTFRKYLDNQTNFRAAVPGKMLGQARLAVKDEYTFDFLELGEEHTEKELERALILKVNRFLTEMGGVFTFAGSQYRLEVDGQEYFIDILLYHRHLKCLVAVELKVGEFIPEHVGKMQFYLAALDSQVKTPEENPSMGIVICKSKKRTTVEYSLRESRKPIGVSTYKVFNAVPEKFKKALPSPAQVVLLLEEGFSENGKSAAK